ncbi:MAG: glutaredoxin family protein [Bacteroidota bacterium]
MSNDKLHLYGADWCLKSANLRNYLQSIWVEFDDFNVEEDSDAAERVKALYDGTLKFPTITFGSEHLKNPKIGELDAFLKKHNLLD